MNLPGTSGSKAEVVTSEEAVPDAIVLSAVVSIEADGDAETVAEDGACPFETEHPPITSERIAAIVRIAIILFIFSPC